MYSKKSLKLLSLTKFGEDILKTTQLCPVLGKFWCSFPWFSSWECWKPNLGRFASPTSSGQRVRITSTTPPFSETLSLISAHINTEIKVFNVLYGYPQPFILGNMKLTTSPSGKNLRFFVFPDIKRMQGWNKKQSWAASPTQKSLEKEKYELHLEGLITSLLKGVGYHSSLS